tara:strand:+ start:1536 stop:2438 length:903 start_codon:yes stop_codon:yes gene_type:complete
MSDIKLKAASGGGSISLKGPSSAGSDTDFLDTSGNLKVTGNATVDDKVRIGTTTNAANEQLTVLGTTSSEFQNGFYRNYTSGARGFNLNIGAKKTDGTLVAGAQIIGEVDQADCTSGQFAIKTLTSSSLTEKVRVDSSGNLTISDGDLKIGTAGHGIDFSATANGGGTSTTSELLDDYEEGTWTPVDASGGSVSFTDTAGNCKYTKIGRLVIASFTVTYLSTSDSSQARVGGLPYACVGTTNNNASVALGETNDDQSTRMVVNQGQSYMLILHCDDAVDVRTNAEASGHNYRGTAIYQTA